MSRLYLVDNSVLQRVHRSPQVTEALISLLDSGELAACLPQVLEEGYSARSAEEHGLIVGANAKAKVFLVPDEQVADIAIELQIRLFGAGIGRSVGVSDVQIAATAIRHSNPRQTVTVVHYDADFENVARVWPEFDHRWIVSRGSVA